MDAFLFFIVIAVILAILPRLMNNGYIPLTREQARIVVYLGYFLVLLAATLWLYVF